MPSRTPAAPRRPPPALREIAGTPTRRPRAPWRCRTLARSDASVPEVVAGVAAGVLLQVLLVVILGGPEGAGGDDLGDDLALPFAGAGDLVLDAFGGLSLLVVVVEDRGAVLRADVVTLAVEGRRVVHAEGVAEELLVAQA